MEKSTLAIVGVAAIAGLLGGWAIAKGAPFIRKDPRPYTRMPPPPMYPQYRPLPPPPPPM